MGILRSNLDRPFCAISGHSFDLNNEKSFESQMDKIYFSARKILKIATIFALMIRDFEHETLLNIQRKTN